MKSDGQVVSLDCVPGIQHARSEPTGNLRFSEFHFKVKKSLEIILRTIHLDSARRVVTLDFGDGSPADSFLTSLSQSNRDGFDALRARIRSVANHFRYENSHTFRSLGDGLYEFKTKKSGLRLYSFYDEFHGFQPQLIIVTSGGGKGGQASDIRKARELRKRYLTTKAMPGTSIEIREQNA